MVAFGLKRRLMVAQFLRLHNILGASKVRYLLRDEFTDTRAAGSVDGTAATPGPGTRTVTDTNSKLSVGSDVASFATGGVGYRDPRMSYDSVTRSAGRTLIAQLNISSEGLYIALSQNTTSVSQTALRFSNTNIYTDRGSANWLIVGSFAVSTNYVVALVQRTAGDYVFIKGGAFTSWTLLYLDTAGTTSTVYPTICAEDSSSIATSDYIRIPDVLWLPTPVAYDTFTRANGALGSSETTGPDSQTITAQTWNNRVGTTQIASNKASASALSGGLAIATVDTSTVDVVMQATLARSGNEVGVVLRYADADNYVRAIHDGTNCKLIKRVATVETDVISAAVAIGNGNISVVADGTAFSLYLDDEQVGSTSTISDAGLQTGTEQGLFSTNTNNTQDGFLVMPRGSDDEYIDLDGY